MTGKGDYGIGRTAKTAFELHVWSARGQCKRTSPPPAKIDSDEKIGWRLAKAIEVYPQTST